MTNSIFLKSTTTVRENMNTIQNNLEKTIEIDNHNIVIRPITLDDVQREKDFVAKLSPESRRFRFFSGIHDLSDKAARQLCDIDFDETMAFISVIDDHSTDNKPQEIGVSRFATDDDGNCECALTIADEWQNKGLGRILMDTLIEYARSKNKTTIYSNEMRANIHMKDLSNDLGMKSKVDAEEPSLIRYELLLTA